MAFYTMIGLVAVAGVVAAGVYWLLSNVTFKRQSERYTYKTDEAGNEYVQDNFVTSKDKSDAKA
jgi:hypothetical protein